MGFSTDDIDAFWARVDSSAGSEGCWEWTGSRNPRTGHGYLTLGSRQQFAHRLAYQLSGHSIPVGMLIMHTCGNPSCCNPGHLEMGTRADQMARRSRRRALALVD